MAGTGAGYDFDVTTYSPDGRIFQVEYAMKAVENSGTALAICCKDGIVFAVEKFMLSKMLVPGTTKRTFPVTRQVGMAVAGCLPDARVLVQRGREEVNSWLNAYQEEMPASNLAERVSLFMHAYTLYGHVRPFGASVLLGGVDKETQIPSLFCIEPQGMVYKYQASAIGKGKQAAKTELEKMFASGEELTCQKVLPLAARILHKVHDEKDKDFELEMSWICTASKNQFAAVPADLVKAASTEAQKMIEADEED